MILAGKEMLQNLYLFFWLSCLKRSTERYITANYWFNNIILWIRLIPIETKKDQLPQLKVNLSQYYRKARSFLKISQETYRNTFKRESYALTFIIQLMNSCIKSLAKRTHNQVNIKYIFTILWSKKKAYKLVPNILTSTVPVAWATEWYWTNHYGPR